MNTALLVIDAQNTYTDPDSELFCQDAKNTVKRINRIIERFQDTDQPIVYIRHVHKADGSDLGRMFDYSGEAEDFNFVEGTAEVEYDARLLRSANAVEFMKNRYSAFSAPGFERWLRSESIGRVVVTGFMTNFCCEGTAREAHDRDYYVDFIVDATGSPGTDNYDESAVRKYVADVMEAGIARVITTSKYMKVGSER